jgi:NADPH:quinone reductase
MMTPKTYNALELAAYNTNLIKAVLSLKIVEKTLPRPGKHQLLIKMAYAPCNPSDVAFLQGAYGVIKTTPTVPGFEGAGFVEAVGPGLDPAAWQGKLVSCFAQGNADGTWAEYFVADTRQLIVIDKQLGPKQAACFFVNPFTAWGLADLAIKKRTPAVIINAAGSQLSAFLLELLRRKGIKTIGIVRKAEHKTPLTASGFDQVLVSTEGQFEEKLQQAAKGLQANLAFDAVGGSMTGQLFNAMQRGSEVVVYGGLSGKAIEGLSVVEAIFNRKKLSAFNLGDWIHETDMTILKKAKNDLSEMIISDHVKTNIQTEVTMTAIAKGMRLYLSDMTSGKMLIRFNE